MSTEEQREQLIVMAEQWESLARDRETLVTKHPELDKPRERRSARRGN